MSIFNSLKRFYNEMRKRLALHYKNEETIWSQFSKEEIQLVNI